jgi:hypothetical protein
MTDKPDDTTSAPPNFGPYGPAPFGPYGAAAYGPGNWGPPPNWGPAYGAPGWGPPPGYAPPSASAESPDEDKRGPRAGWGYPPGFPPGYGPGWGHGWGHHHGGWWPGCPMPGWGAGAPPPWAPNWGAPPAAAKEDGSSLFSTGLGVHNDALIKGLLIGAGLTFLLTNDSVQKNLIGAAVKIWSTLQGGVEEMKERFRDAEAELAAGEDEAG